MKRLLIVVTIITIQFASLVFAQEEMKESEPPKPECGDFSACFNAAAMAFGQRDYAGAIALFTRAAEFGDDNQKAVCKTNIGNAWYNTGLTLSQAGNYEDAKKAFNNAIDYGINTSDVHMFRGYAYLILGDYHLASNDFAGGSEDQYKRRGLYLQRITGIYADGSGCIEYVDWLNKNRIKELPAPPTNRKTYTYIPSGYHDMNGNSVKPPPSVLPAYRESDSYYSCDPDKNPMFKKIQDDLYWRASQDPELKKLLSDKQQSWGLPDNPNEVFFTTDDFEKSYYPLDRSGLKYKLSSPEAYTMRGKAFLQAKKHDKAIEDFTNAIAMSPNSPEAYLHRAAAYEQTGQPQLAIEDLSKYLELSLFLEDTEKQEIEQRIQALKSALDKDQNGGDANQENQ